jgi:hypothetical protein
MFQMNLLMLSSVLKMEIAGSFKTLVPNAKLCGFPFPEQCNINICLCENLRCHNNESFDYITGSHNQLMDVMVSLHFACLMVKKFKNFHLNASLYRGDMNIANFMDLYQSCLFISLNSFIIHF